MIESAQWADSMKKKKKNKNIGSGNLCVLGKNLCFILGCFFVSQYKYSFNCVLFLVVLMTLKRNVVNGILNM